MRGRKTKTKTENELLNALRFISCAQRSVGTPEQTHCRFFHQWVCSSNGIISAGHKTSENISVAPHTISLIDAMEQAPDAIALTSTDTGMSVKSGLFEALISCIPTASLPQVWPDQPTQLCDNRLQTALDIVGKLVFDGAPKVINASIQLRNGSVVASDGSIILEVWHGISMQPMMIAPKAMATALNKNLTKSIYRYGQSDTSLTVWYEDESWIKTQLYPSSTELPDIDQFLNIPTTPVAITPAIFIAAKRLEKFSEDGWISFTGDGARVTMPSKMTYAIEAVKDVPVGLSFSIKSLLTIAPFVKTIHFNVKPGVTMFYGDNLRGAITNKNGEL